MTPSLGALGGVSPLVSVIHGGTLLASLVLPLPLHDPMLLQGVSAKRGHSSAFTHEPVYFSTALVSLS